METKDVNSVRAAARCLLDIRQALERDHKAVHDGINGACRGRGKNGAGPQERMLGVVT